MSAAGYTTTNELQRILKITNASADQVDAMTRVLTAAYVEILKEIDLPDGVVLTDDEMTLAAEVNLERAVEHWQAEESGFGVIGLSDTGPVYTARNSWERHAYKLAPLKQQWGMA